MSQVIITYQGPEQFKDQVGYQTRHSAGCDVITTETVIIPSKGSALIDTGMVITQSSPTHDPLLLIMRSSLAKRGLIMCGGIGLIDSDYRGKIGMFVYNTTDSGIQLNAGDRVAQLMQTPFISIGGVHRKEIPREGGFGSSGK